MWAWFSKALTFFIKNLERDQDVTRMSICNWWWKQPGWKCRQETDLGQAGLFCDGRLSQQSAVILPYDYAIRTVAHGRKILIEVRLYYQEGMIMP